MKRGDPVICNGYPGTVTEVHTGQLEGMVSVRLAPSEVCVSAGYPDCYLSAPAPMTAADQTTANNAAIRDIFQEFAIERARMEIRIDELLAENSQLNKSVALAILAEIETVRINPANSTACNDWCFRRCQAAVAGAAGFTNRAEWTNNAQLRAERELSR